MKKHRDKIKNYYFRKKAASIKCRDVEEEFRLARDHSSLDKSKRLLIDSLQLKYHFGKHFDVRNVVFQPAIENPNLFPYFNTRKYQHK